MKKTYVFIMLLCITSIYSQQKTFEKEISKISKKIEQITTNEKDSLQLKVKEILKSLEKGEISETMAATLKKEAAIYHAQMIEDKVGIQQLKLQELVQAKVDGKIQNIEHIEDKVDENTFTIGNKVFRFKIDGKEDDLEDEKEQHQKSKTNKKTTTQFVFALGVNNVLTANQFSSLNDSEYEFWKSHFYELGWTWKTRFTNTPSNFYLKYGFSFLWNNLRLTSNRIHIKNNDLTVLESFDDPLTESRLRHVQLTFPVHIEWDLSRNKRYEDGFIKDRTHESIRLGIGGFTGFKLGTRQYIEYKNSEGVRIEELQRENFNMNTINYGISAYLSYKSSGLYVKYDLNSLFKNTETRNISLGLRFDFD